MRFSEIFNLYVVYEAMGGWNYICTVEHGEGEPLQYMVGSTRAWYAWYAWYAKYEGAPRSCVCVIEVADRAWCMCDRMREVGLGMLGMRGMQSMRGVELGMRGMQSMREVGLGMLGMRGMRSSRAP